MTANVEPQEVEALVGLLGQDASKPARVSDRDFDQPLRLGQRALEEIERRTEGVLLAVSRHLASELQQELRVELAALREVHADLVRSRLSEPLAAVRFQAAGQPGWLVWDNEAAVAAVERLLCGDASSEESRPLSELERNILGRVLGGVARAIGEVHSVSAEGFEVVDAVGTFGSWRDAGEVADPHRLCFDLVVKHGEDSSDLQLYLPGFHAGDAASDAEAREELPGHLAEVAVELTALLGETEVPLAELLALEEGDVIPLGVPGDTTLAITIDGCQVARARLGTSEGRFAIALTEEISGSGGSGSDGGHDE